jgi:hypothetical protein
MQSILRKIDLIILIVIAIVASTLSVLHFFEFTKIASYQFPVFTLFLLGMIGLHLIVAHFTQEDFRKDTSNLLKKLEKSANIGDFRLFNDSMEIESYLGKRMLEAKKSICDLTWKTKISAGFSASDRQIAHSYMDKCITQTSDRIPYREIFIFNDPRRVEKLERRLSENKKGYSCKYFKNDSPIPRIQFVIVDDEEVFFFASSADSILCSFRNKELCKVFKSYYEAIWDSAITIKDGPWIDHEQVELIRKIKFKK